MQYTKDASGKVLGRLASEIVVILRGKNDPAFLSHSIPKNKVTITNASQLRLTGNKLATKVYKHYSGYPGGLKSETLTAIIEKKGVGEALKRAVYGMLPNNKLRHLMMNNLTIKD